MFCLFFVGLYGFSYIEAGKNVFQLFQQKGWTVIITDDLGNVYEFFDEKENNNEIKTKEGYNYRSVEKFKAEKTFSFLKKTEKSFISVSDVDSILRDEFKEFYEQNEDLKSKNSRLCVPIDVTCLLFGACNGSDCGCCGNYSGLCWLCNLAC